MEFSYDLGAGAMHIIDVVAFLGKDPDLLVSSLELASDAARIEIIDGLTYGEVRLAGISFVVGEDAKLRTVHLHAANHEGYGEYTGVLPFGLGFNASRKEVRANLGQPDASQEPGVMSILGPTNAWDRFDLNEFRLHIEYAPGENGIVMVTVMTNIIEPVLPADDDR